MANPSFKRSRVQQHSKRRKTSFVLNILIGIVFVLIIIVGGSILFGSDNDNQSASGDTKATENSNTGQDSAAEGKTNTSEDDQSDSDDTDVNDDETTSDSDESTSEEEDTDEGEEIITEDSDDPNVVQTIQNSSWEPVGTQQIGEHTTQYDKGSTDRAEMEKAMSYATNIATDDMIVWWLENGGNPNQNVVGTISTSDQSKIYRVYLEWVDGKGWQPTKVEQLKENDKK